jgi:hypothetical protein
MCHNQFYRFNLLHTLHKAQRKILLNNQMEYHAQFIAASFFTGLFLIAGFGSYSLIKWVTLSRIWIAISLAIIFIPWRFFPIIYKSNKELKVLLGFFGLGPLLTGLFLMLNFLIVIETKDEVFPVTKVVYIYAEQSFEVSFIVDGMEPHRESRRIKTEIADKIPELVLYQVNTGIFMVKSLRNGKLIFAIETPHP